MHLLMLFSLLSWAAVGGAQVTRAAGGKKADAQSEPAAQLSPQAAYEQAVAPIDITHRDIANWSDIELNSMSVAIEEAKRACAEREQVTYAGDDVIGYARLCALGQQWPDVYRAATQYINSGDKQRPQLAQAYAFEVQADLNMNKGSEAEGAAVAMLKSVPYSALVDDVTSGTVRYLQFSAVPDALHLLRTRQPVLLGLLRGVPPDPQDWPSEPAISPIPLHTVVQHALDLAALEQYDGSPEEARTTVWRIDQALPKQLPPDEAILITAERRQYELIGTKMPELKGISLEGAADIHGAKPVYGKVTVFLLFPPWCAQCLRLGPQLQPAMDRAGASGLRIYALLAEVPPEPPKPVARKAPTDAAATKRTGHTSVHMTEASGITPPSELLRKTSTLVVPPETLEEFGAADFPFLVATDHDGIVRLLYPAAPNNMLVEGGIIDQLTQNILSHWPPKSTERSLPSALSR